LIGLLIESVLHELLLQQEVLKLLFLHAFAILVGCCVHEAQFSQLLALSVLDGQVVQYALSGINLRVVTFALPPQEITASLSRLTQAFITCRKSFHVLLTVIIDSHCGAISQLARFLCRQIELVVDFLALVVKLIFTFRLVLLVDFILPVELAMASLFNFVNRTHRGVLLASGIGLDLLKCSLCFGS